MLYWILHTRPVFLLMGPVIFVFLILPYSGLPRRFWRRLVNVGVAAAGFLVVVVPISFFLWTTTGHWGLVPPSGGINFFIGNNLNYEETVNIRPGLAWADLVAEPARNGYKPNPWSGDQYYKNETYKFIMSYPGKFVAGLGDKALTLISSREIPRNIDIYLHREWSGLLSFLAWKVWGWGFPFGVIFPLMLVGITRVSKKLPVVLVTVLGALMVSPILVFVSARYRVPLVPLFVVLAAKGIVVTLAATHRKKIRELVGIGVVVVVGVFVCVFPGPFAQESVDLTAELYFGVAEDLYDQEDWRGAVFYMERSIDLDPDLHASRQIMGISLANLNQYDLAISHFREAVRLRPNHASTRENLETCIQNRARVRFLGGREVELEDPLQAIFEYQAAEQDAPTWYKPIARQAFVLATTKVDSIRDGEKAIVLARHAIYLRDQTDPYLQFVLAVALAEAGYFDEALLQANTVLFYITDKKNNAMVEEVERAIELFKLRQTIRR